MKKVEAIRTFFKEGLVRRGEILEVHENYAKRNPHLVQPIGPEQNKIDRPDETKSGGLQDPPVEPDKSENPPQDPPNDPPQEVLPEAPPEDPPGEDDPPKDPSVDPPPDPDVDEVPPGNRDDEDEDGVDLIYRCLECGRDDFKSAQGLASHQKHCKGAGNDGGD